MAATEQRRWLNKCRKGELNPKFRRLIRGLQLGKGTSCKKKKRGGEATSELLERELKKNWGQQKVPSQLREGTDMQKWGRKTEMWDMHEKKG